MKGHRRHRDGVTSRERADWVSFWKDHEDSARLVVEVSTWVAAIRMMRKFEIGSGHDVLDFGCGPGFLCDLLWRQGVTIVGADINAATIASNRLRYPDVPFVVISESPETTGETFNREFGSRKFDHIILLSVVQYLPNLDDLNSLIGMLGTFLKRGGALVIADVIDSSTSPAIDAMGAFFHAAKRGKLGGFLAFARQLTGRNYRSVASGQKLLKVESADMERIANQHGLKLSTYRNLTVHPTRKTYSLQN
jgi:2-polyprenyl-3-methyl-5-hydroxy-6-metoxy-1,4-benzoquinol methylase